VDGKAVLIPMHQVPKGEALGDGPSLNELSLGQAKKNIVAGLALPKEESAGYLFLVSRGGKVKRITMSDFANVRGNETVVMGLDSDDSLLAVFATPGESEVILVSALGQGIRFAEEEVRPMGLPAGGVYGIKLAKGDEVVGAGFIKAWSELLVVTEKGLGKRTDVEEFSRRVATARV
jgi:DNA gyrase subunit A